MPSAASAGAESVKVTPQAPPLPTVKQEPAVKSAPADLPIARPSLALPPPEMPAQELPKAPPPKLPVEKSPKAPAKPIEQPAEKPAEKAAPSVPAVPAKPAAPEPAKPVTPQVPAKPAKPAEDNPFGKNDVRGLRMWTDISGKYRIEARLVSFQDGVVRLATDDGNVFRIQAENLSVVDQQWIHGQTRSLATAR